VVEGSEAALCDAIRRGADLLVGTEFRHNEHIDVTSDNPEMIREVAEFRVTYLLEDRWAAGIMSLRQPISLPDRFGERPSMSFFLYNQNGSQAIARPYLDGRTPMDDTGASQLEAHSDMPKYHQLDRWDADTNAPSSNFIYDFELYRFLVRDNWQEVLSHDSDGTVLSGSVDALTEAFASGCEVKTAVRGLCNDLAENPAETVDHEVFVQAGSCYYYTQQRLFIAGSHPVIRVRPAIPLEYTSRGWDFGWLMLRTDGSAVQRICDPRTLRFADTHGRYAMRWFVT
jgi:hypothetical protein